MKLDLQLAWPDYHTERNVLEGSPCSTFDALDANARSACGVKPFPYDFRSEFLDQTLAGEQVRDKNERAGLNSPSMRTPNEPRQSLGAIFRPIVPPYTCAQKHFN